MFIINLHDLQMLFIFWIKSKFSESLAPYTNMKASNGRLSGDVFSQAPKHGVRHSGAVTPNLFGALPDFLCSEKFALNVW